MPERTAAPRYRLHARDAAAKTTTYVKDDPRTQIRTYLIFEGDGTVRVRKTQRVDAVLDLNAAQANAFGGYRGKSMVCTSRVPMVEWSKLMNRCGRENSEYDGKKLRQILNDPDYRAFKTIPGKV